MSHCLRCQREDCGHMHVAGTHCYECACGPRRSIDDNLFGLVSRIMVVLALSLAVLSILQRYL